MDAKIRPEVIIRLGDLFEEAIKEIGFPVTVEEVASAMLCKVCSTIGSMQPNAIERTYAWVDLGEMLRRAIGATEESIREEKEANALMPAAERAEAAQS